MNSEDRALKNILQGKPVTKSIMVGYEGKKQETGDQKSRLTDIMAAVRMPWFCPSCDKIMKKNLDNKMWRLYGHCFDCQIQEEHELRSKGLFKQWEDRKILINKRSIIEGQIKEIEEFISAGDTEVVEPVNVDTGYVHIEKYELDEKIKKEAEEALVSLDAALTNVNKTIKKLDAELEEN
jgi:ribosomal protein L37AE/L43A